MVKVIPNLRTVRRLLHLRLLHLALAALIGFGLVVIQVGVTTSSGVFKLTPSQPVIAQGFRPQEVWQRVYERLPDLPLENQYISQETGEVDADNTLVGRLIRYHLYVKSRPPYYRLDWKLTMADYLGAHEYLVASQYPGGNTLNENPMEGDRAAIQRLTRAQRNALVDVLVSLFNPNLPENPPPTPRESPSPLPTPNPRSTPGLPQPGDADLLRP
ncbi:MAG TPA: hypothetical protein DCL61_03280 [Cyanobacteria bacterium UBA12227]|nr:hypothetical protein [Cyanobacteria bacterium UBA12227]HAX89369.1 hypothetical protein [Cyanobacteria bacterium UBA11370]HBY75669.1 hypothetical protein [Cyanobacteria bacterium UBA11148]